jgi:hypothetical protein
MTTSFPANGPENSSRLFIGLPVMNLYIILRMCFFAHLHQQKSVMATLTSRLAWCYAEGSLSNFLPGGHDFPWSKSGSCAWA